MKDGGKSVLVDHGVEIFRKRFRCHRFYVVVVRIADRDRERQAVPAALEQPSQDIVPDVFIVNT